VDREGVAHKGGENLNAVLANYLIGDVLAALDQVAGEASTKDEREKWERLRREFGG